MRRFDRKNILLLMGPQDKNYRRKIANIRYCNKLPLPVLNMGYACVCSFLFAIYVLHFSFAIVEDIGNIIYVHTIFLIVCALTFAAFNIRVVNAAAKAKILWKSGKLFSVTILPGLIIGCGLGASFTVFRNVDLMYIYGDILLACICLAVVSHINFQSLGVFIVFAVVKWIFVIITFQGIF